MFCIAGNYCGGKTAESVRGIYQTQGFGICIQLCLYLYFIHLHAGTYPRGKSLASWRVSGVSTKHRLTILQGFGLWGSGPPGSYVIDLLLLQHHDDDEMVMSRRGPIGW